MTHQIGDGDCVHEELAAVDCKQNAHAQPQCHSEEEDDEPRIAQALKGETATIRKSEGCGTATR